MTTGRRRIGWWPVLASALGVFVLAAALGFFVSSRGDRDDAVAERGHAQHAVQEAHAALADAKDDLAEDRTVGRHVVEPVQPLTASVQSLLDLSSQELGEARIAQSLGSSIGSSVDDYNASVDRANGIADQYNATLDTIRQQISDLLGEVNEQIA
jgi:hypothetical protein